MQYRNIIDSRGISLLQDECPEDAFALVKILNLIERISNLTRPKDGSFNPKSEMNVQMFTNELLDWRATTSPEIRNLRMPVQSH